MIELICGAMNTLFLQKTLYLRVFLFLQLYTFSFDNVRDGIFPSTDSLALAQNFG